MTSHEMFHRTDEVPDPLFAHTPLDLTKSSLRLLRILSISSKGVIDCELSIHDFEDRDGLFHDPPGTGRIYDALSYEWGPDEPPFHWIRLNNSWFRLRHNLYCFLQVAYSKLSSKSDLAGLLWIDAICIDQDNILERGHQVKQMGQIYKSASTVLVWLGPGVDKRLGLSATHHLALWILWSETAVNHTPPNLPLLPDNEANSAFKAICELSYWTRMWIIQEIHLARKAMLIAGEMILPWEPFRQMMRNYQLQVEDLSQFPALQVVTYLSKDYKKATLCDLVYAFGDGQCSDARDRAYAIRGLLQCESFFQVDYSITEVELFCAIMMASYETMCGSPEPQNSGILARVLPYGLSCFNRKRADVTDVFHIIARVLKAMHVSFTTLDEYLQPRPHLGLDTLLCLSFTERTIEKTDTAGSCVNSFLIENITTSRRTIIVLQDLDQHIEEGVLHRATSKIMQKHISTKCGRDGRYETLTYFAESPLVAYWTWDGTALWLSFRAVMFLVKAMHTIRSLTIDKLDKIADRGGSIKMTVDVDGTQHIMVDLTSSLSDVKF